MKYIHLYLTYFLCLITSLIYTGCKDDESELIPNTFEISSSDLNKEIDFRSTTMSIPVKNKSANQPMERQFRRKMGYSFPTG